MRTHARNRSSLLTVGDIPEAVYPSKAPSTSAAGTSMFERSDNGGVKSDSKSNENEAALVVRHVETLIAAGVQPSSISVISPYIAQVNLLVSSLRPRFPDLEIGSVDGFQGSPKLIRP